ncbi:hypothetical protein [Secundilactobacillus angelensis]
MRRGNRPSDESNLQVVTATNVRSGHWECAHYSNEVSWTDRASACRTFKVNHREVVEN